MKRITVAAALMIVLGISACTMFRSNVLRLVSALPEGVVSRTQPLQFTFSRKVATPIMINVWLTDPYIEFTPAIPGRFVWQDSVHLVFSPDGILPGDAKFHGKLNTALLLKLSGYSSFGGDEEFDFSTESFRLKSAEFFYDRMGDQRSVGIRANLELTYAALPEDVAKYLVVTIDGDRIQDVKVKETRPARVIPVDIGVFTGHDKPREIAVRFEEGLVSPETNTPITVEKPFVYTLPPIEELKILGHAFAFGTPQSTIRINFSQEVDPAEAKPFISIEPKKDFTLTAEGSALVLSGKFETGTPLKMTVQKGLESLLGGKLQNDYVADIVIGNVEPSFDFASRGAYMLLTGGRSLELTTVNMSSLQVRVSQIFQNNLVFFLDGGRYYDYGYESYYDEEEGDYVNRWSRRRKYRFSVKNYGRSLGTTKISIAGPPNQPVSTWFDLSPYLRKDYKGFYLVEIANPSSSWRSTGKLVSLSDLGLIVKRSKRDVTVFVVDLGTNDPVPDATVSLISTNNQVITSMKSDRDGVARFANYDEASVGFNLKLVTAERGDDFNFINLSDYGVETSRFDVGGKYDVAGRYDAFLYGDRNIYRPGETVILSGIIRNLTQEIPEGMPVRVKVINPKGNTVSELQRTLNAQGSFELKYETLPTALTGEYQFDVYGGDNLYLANYRVMVEDFVPDRLRIQLSVAQTQAAPGDKLKYEFQAFNFFGPPAAGRDWEFEGTFQHFPYSSRRFPQFRFSDDDAKEFTAEPAVFTGKTDAEGKASVEFKVPENVTSSGVLRARGRVAVLDESGRAVYQLAQTNVFPKPYLIGVRWSHDYYIRPNTPQTVQLVAVTPKDEPIANFRARVQLIRLEWHSVLRQHSGSNTLRYVSEKREIPVREEEIVLGTEPTTYKYSVPRSGEYVVRVSKAGESGYNQFSFYSYSWGTTDVTSFEVDPEARVEMVFDKSVYAPGDRAHILFQTPFSGKMLVTLERNQLFEYRYLNVVNNAAAMDIPVEEKYLPNVYVSAVLFRKVKERSIPLLAGHGFKPLMVEKPSNKLDVAITAPERIRPKTKQKIVIKAGTEKDVYVTLAAVDEGICQVRGYRTPDPYGYFYAKKALEVGTFDFFRDLLPESGDKKTTERSSTGGGEGEEMAKRVNPLGVQRFKPVALWSGLVTTDGSGNAEVTLDVPEFSGEVRLMALAYKGDRFGSAQKAMKVSDPVVITPALPRFLSPGDGITMPITAFNTTDKPVKLEMAIEATGGLTPTPTTTSLDVGANQERFVNVALRAGEEIGAATVKVKTKAFGESLESTTELPVRPVSPFTSESYIGFADRANPASFDIPDAFLSFNRRAYITLSPFPVANFAKQLKYLVGYPHGCIEQTTSKAFPQIYLRDVALLLNPSIISKGSPAYFVNEAITKLGTMQLASGAFAYWPGGNYTNDWCTVYATHFLVEAKKAGYAVQEGMHSSALRAVATIARSKSTVDYAFYSANRTSYRRIANKTVIYALYVLAAGGQPDVTVMNFYRREGSLLTLDTRYLLAGAFALSGDRKAYVELVPKEFQVEQAARMSGGWFDSDIRANALILNVLLETDQNNPNIPRYMEYLSRRYKELGWWSTQDIAFTMLGLGKAARMAGTTKASGTVSVGGQTLTFSGSTQKLDLKPFGKKVTVNVKTDGRVYFSIVTEGIRKDGSVPLGDKNLQVRREYFNRFGQPVDLQAVRQNELLIVRITLRSNVDRLENIAISDLLPAGFEIENPRLTEASQYNFIKNPMTPTYMDIRDDRINIYTDFRGRSRQQMFYYIARAVTAGEFDLAPIVAEAMYDGAYFSAHGRQRVKVVR